MSAHTPEPWHTDGPEIVSKDGRIIASTIWSDWKQREDDGNAQRIVTCVNTLEGVDDPAAELAKLRACISALFAIQRAACGEDQVADDAEGGLRWIYNAATAALSEVAP